MFLSMMGKTSNKLFPIISDIFFQVYIGGVLRPESQLRTVESETTNVLFISFFISARFFLLKIVLNICAIIIRKGLIG